MKEQWRFSVVELGLKLSGLCGAFSRTLFVGVEIASPLFGLVGLSHELSKFTGGGQQNQKKLRRGSVVNVQRVLQSRSRAA
jgi:hypothetical protein